RRCRRPGRAVRSARPLHVAPARQSAPSAWHSARPLRSLTQPFNEPARLAVTLGDHLPAQPAVRLPRGRRLLVGVDVAEGAPEADVEAYMTARVVLLRMGSDPLLGLALERVRDLGTASVRIANPVGHDVGVVRPGVPEQARASYEPSRGRSPSHALH